MTIKLFVKRFFSMFATLLLIMLIGTAVFAFGAKAGRQHQMINNTEMTTTLDAIVQYCSAELVKFEELKDVANKSSADVHKLKSDPLCEKLCVFLTDRADGMLKVRNSYVGVSGDCICFVTPNYE